MLWLLRSCRLFHSHAMDLDAVGFIVHGMTKTQHPGPIRDATVWFEVLSEPRQPPEQQT